MKTLSVALIILFSTAIINAQNKNNSVITQTLHVKGNCGQCKERIESAVDVKGVKYAEWNKKTQILTITYKPSIISIDEIKNKILKVGHDVDSLQADEKAYQKLPDCCKFRDVKPH
ncbi:MAG: hypothetical protein KatS3mg027_0474 [Bacteroidia bacterium]|nr:MAG: hypothetical protein KatS3mg027_0474 [Bacteroidia bacterium]